MPVQSASSCWVVKLDGLTISVRRSAKRRTLSLQVRDGMATLYAPSRMPHETIEAFVYRKKDWLAKHLQRQAASRPSLQALGQGSLIPFLGETLTLQFDRGLSRARREGGILLLPGDDTVLGDDTLPGDDTAHRIKEHLKVWTQQAALPHYTRRAEHFANILGARPKLRRVLVSSARTRWGSCTSTGDIRLHYALSRGPLEALDYVVLHEAAHLLELNHSPRYWAHVQRVMPEYPRWRKWLREQGHTLILA